MIRNIVFTLTTIVATGLTPLFAGSQQSIATESEKNSFGYLLYSDDSVDIWWSSGTFRIMPDTPRPEKEGDTILLKMARNEYESAQIVVRSRKPLRNARVEVGELTGAGGTVKTGESTLRKVEYVYVSKPTDSYGSKGWWPDPLPLVEGPVNLEAGINNTFFITFHTPPHRRAGKYHGDITLSWNNFKKTIPATAEVWNFSLPDVPSIRSGFGLSYDKIAAYHNITGREELEKCYDLYMEQFRRYRIAPYYPHALAPARDSVTGILWKGGLFEENPGGAGLTMLIDDDDATRNIKAEYILPVTVSPESEYLLEWRARTDKADQQFCVLLEGYNAEGDKLIFENRMEVFTGSERWKNYRFASGNPGQDVSYYRLTIFPVFRTEAGENTGKAWFDDIRLTTTGSRANLLEQGEFDIDPDAVDVIFDFSRFDIALSRYLDDFGFNSFRIDLPGMGSGTYYSRNEGRYGGFRQGTVIYNKLMMSYLSQIEAHLREKGWLDRVYVYWFDEPGRIDYPFVREGMEIIRRGAPEISTFLTENDPGPEIMDVTDISCTIWHRIDPDKARMVKEMGNEYWSYLCTAPKHPWLSEFIDHDGINLRMWLWGTWAYDLDGILIWSTNYWTSRSASPPGYLQNPWEDPASYVQGYGWPLGKQTQWGNGDGRLFYPPNRNPGKDIRVFIEEPVPSFRLEQLREGIEDYEYLTLLKELASRLPQTAVYNEKLYNRAMDLITIPDSIFRDGKSYTKDAADLLNYRTEIALLIEELTNNVKTREDAVPVE
ncbi:MAG: DUF4091 domain-containing protein [Bacteroidales bacterium]|nr:DUF4091 domain-containing protein [Bacteroidales bacterium]